VSVIELVLAVALLIPSLMSLASSSK